MRNALATFGAVAVLLPCLLVGAAGPAAAHATLLSTDPADQSSIEVAPKAVTLTFNEPVGRPAVVVTAPDGSRVSGRVSALDSKVTADLTGAAQKGTYTVAYRVVSVDGHPIAGESTFTTTTGKTVTQKAAPQEKTFVHRHRSHIVWAVLAALVGIALVLGPLLRKPKQRA